MVDETLFAEARTFEPRCMPLKTPCANSTKVTFMTLLVEFVPFRVNVKVAPSVNAAEYSISAKMLLPHLCPPQNKTDLLKSTLGDTATVSEELPVVSVVEIC
jgi:hypothetical protein